LPILPDAASLIAAIGLSTALVRKKWPRSTLPQFQLII